MDFLTEAFKGLQTLNEETFPITTDPDGESDLRDFLDKDDEIDTVTIIDPDAETEEDLEDSYIGKVILDCNVCHSLIYKNAEDVHINEDGDTANDDEECPFCYSVDGFKIIGQVKPFGQDDEEDDETEDEEEVEETDIETEEDKDIVKESLSGRSRRRMLKEAAKRRRCTRKPVSEFFDVDVSVPIDAHGQSVGIAGGTGSTGGGPMMGAGTSAVAEGDEDRKRMPRRRPGKRSRCANGECEDKELLQEKPCKEACGRRPNRKNESIEKMSFETEDTKMEMTSDPNGKVTITTEPKADEDFGEPSFDEAGENLPDETIGEIDDTVKDEIEAGDEEVDAEEETDETSDEDEIEVDEFDEETFESLGESYLKKVYGNVKSFKVSSVHESNSNRLFIEGLITFSSGNTKKTNFVFKNAGVTKTGKTMFEGYNKEITRSNKSFRLKGRVDGRKIVSESLSYRYNQNKKLINGTVK